jgi:hypothetical protein
MPKGKLWNIEEEKQFRDLVESKTSIRAIAERMKKTPDAVIKKCEHLGLEVVDENPRISTTTSLKIPKELLTRGRSIEDAGCCLEVECSG